MALLSHELRSPLVAIRTALELYRLQGCDPSSWNSIEGIMERQVQRMEALVKNILDLSRILHGKMHLDLRPVELVNVVALSVETTKPSVLARRLRLEICTPTEMITLLADEERLVQVLF